MINYSIDLFFSEINDYLEKKTDENTAYLVLKTILHLASQFNKDEFCEAKNFQYRWGEIKAKLEKFALTNDFKKNSEEIEQKIDEILEPEKWQDLAELRVNGSIECALDEAQDIFDLMAR